MSVVCVSTLVSALASITDDNVGSGAWAGGRREEGTGGGGTGGAAECQVTGGVSALRIAAAVRDIDWVSCDEIVALGESVWPPAAGRKPFFIHCIYKYIYFTSQQFGHTLLN